MKSNTKKHTKKKIIKRKAIAKLTENPKIKGFITFEELETKKLKITYQISSLSSFRKSQIFNNLKLIKCLKLLFF